MLATVIRDVFTKAELPEIEAALDDLCAPDDDYGWASAAVYCFWDPPTRDAMYVGLAVDLPQRFRQHSGSLHTKPECCKKNEIDEWFQKHEKLGYSVFLQSPMSQPMSRRALLRYGPNAEEAAKERAKLVKHGHSAIVYMEGKLIEGYKLNFKKLPPWNKVDGSVLGRARATKLDLHTLDVMTGKLDDGWVARKSLRELSNNITWAAYESYLHGVRLMSSLSMTGFVEDTFASFPEFGEEKSRMERDGYFSGAVAKSLDDASRAHMKKLNGG